MRKKPNLKQLLTEVDVDDEIVVKKKVQLSQDAINRLVDRKKARLFYQEVAKEGVPRQLERFQREVMHSQVITIHNAHHYIFISHAAEVEKQMRTFLKSGPYGKK